MRRLLLLPLAFVSLGQAPAVKGGTIAGTVQAVQKGKPIKLDELYVYLKPAKEPTSAIGKGEVRTILQRKIDGTPEFSPKITVIPKGATVVFPNRDNEEHNVFSPAMKANDWFGFDQGRYKPGTEGKPRDFRQLGEFDIYCDIHKEMWATVKVVPSRYFTRVVDGKYTLSDVAPGVYTVVAWAPGSVETPAEEPTEMIAGAAKTLKTLNVQYKTPNHAHPRLDSSEYGPYPSR